MLPFDSAGLLIAGLAQGDFSGTKIREKSGVKGLDLR